MSNLKFKLFCWVLTKSKTPFSVTIEHDQAVDELKDAIKEKKPATFDGIDADDLLLWRVSVCID